MPLVQFHMSSGISDEARDKICTATQAAIVRSLPDVPEYDLFQIVTRHQAGDLKSTPMWPGKVKREQILYIEILMCRGYDSATKGRMYTAIAEDVSACGVNRQDIFVAVTENSPDDWCAGMA